MSNKRILVKNGKAFIDEKGKVLSSSSVGSAGVPIELSTNEEMIEVLVMENIDKVYKFVGETNETFEYGELYQVIMEVEE